jgi:uncharacterized protein (TIGR00269 family)
MAARVKPLVMIADREMKAYADMEGIPVVTGECPHAKGATSRFYKELLQSLEERSPGVKAQFYFGFLRNLKPHLPPASPEEAEGGAVNRCRRCGYKTTSEESCFICRLKERIRAEAAG